MTGFGFSVILVVMLWMNFRRERMVGMNLEKSLCVDCGACVTACSVGIFRWGEDGRVEVRTKGCMQCFHCAAACPQQAIRCEGLTVEQLYPPKSDSPLLRMIQERRSVRHFTDELPDRAFLQSVLDAARYAPSGKNEHANRWTVVLGRENTDKLFQLTLDWAKEVPAYRHLLKLAQWGRNPVTCGAPCLIVGYNRTDALNPQTDTVIAMTLAEQLLVEAGWGTCWGGYLRAAARESEAIRTLLKIPEGYRIYEILLVGRPDGETYCNVPYRGTAEINWVESGIKE